MKYSLFFTLLTSLASSMTISVEASCSEQACSAEPGAPSLFVCFRTILPCPNEQNGSIIVFNVAGSGFPFVNVDGGPSQIFTGFSDLTFSGLSAGVHSLNVSSTIPPCQISIPVELKVSTPVPTFTVKSACPNQNDGAITITAITGGNPEYQVGLDNGPTQTFSEIIEFSGLEAGVHFINIIDANKCTRNTQVVVSLCPKYPN